MNPKKELVEKFYDEMYNKMPSWMKEDKECIKYLLELVEHHYDMI